MTTRVNMLGVAMVMLSSSYALAEPIEGFCGVSTRDTASDMTSATRAIIDRGIADAAASVSFPDGAFPPTNPELDAAFKRDFSQLQNWAFNGDGTPAGKTVRALFKHVRANHYKTDLGVLRQKEGLLVASENGVWLVLTPWGFEKRSPAGTISPITSRQSFPFKQQKVLEGLSKLGWMLQQGQSLEHLAVTEKSREFPPMAPPHDADAPLGPGR